MLEKTNDLIVEMRDCIDKIHLNGLHPKDKANTIEMIKLLCKINKNTEIFSKKEWVHANIINEDKL